MIPLRYRRPALLVTLALLLLAAGLPLLHWGRDVTARETARTASATSRIEAEQRQLQANIATARELAGRIGAAEVTRLLAPIDRLQTAGVLERQAAAARLTHFVYTLGAERKDTAILTGEAATGLVTSVITIAADAPLDTDAFAFLAGLQAALPGRLRVAQLSLTRTGDGHQPLTAGNVHLEARLDWLSNGSAKTLAGGAVRAWLILFVLCAPGAARAEPVPSLFFTPTETAAIDRLARHPPSESDDRNIRLGAVFYYGPHDWSLWLQGKLWTPQTDQPDLHVIEVQPDTVRLSLTAGGMVAREFTLKPYQTYRPVTDDVREGVR